MAGAFIAGLAGDMLTNTVGSLVTTGANAINQKVEYDFTKQLQSASFQHDKDMLQAQINATKQLQSDMMAIKAGVLTAGGFSPADAARGAVNAPMTKVLDWSGTRYWAPNSTKTTSQSGQFSSTTVHRPFVQSKTVQPSPSRALSSSGSVRSLSTQSTMLSNSSSSSRGTPSTQSTDISSSRTADWVRSQRSLSPYMDGALQTAFVTPPSSRASSTGTVSTVPKGVLDSWTPAFNTRRQPLFAHLRKRGESQA
uniref:Minor structural protein n=1 Tax=Norovirus Hu/GII.4/Beijing/55185/2008/CHN TaxID=679310 RepID=E3SDH7_NORV|nr:minor structural protein [Norovirus Hu/GII.4/Beijing/55185/2008/CHN]